MKWGLAAGQDIEDSKVETLKKEDQFSKAFDKAVNYINYRPRSIKEVITKLDGLGFENFVVVDVIKKLERINLVNDMDFAEMFVRDRLALKPKGKKMLALELKQKGIDSQIIDIVLSTITSEDEINQATEIFKKKNFDNITDKAKKVKAINYLQRRGYSWDVIKEVFIKGTD